MNISWINRLLCLLFVLLFTSVQTTTNTTITRSYCTEIGKFQMLFDEDEVSGSYSLTPKQSLGAIWGKLEGTRMTGRWLDADGQGDIIISFNEDFSWFTTRYRNDKEPDHWYTDQWHGALRPNGKTTFEKDGKTYRCE